MKQDPSLDVFSRSGSQKLSANYRVRNSPSY